MSKEEYVKSGTAKLLRERGFRGDCIAYYNDDGKRYLSLNAELHPLPCPTQAVACRWLRKEYGIHILPEISEVKENPKYYCIIWKTSTLESFIVDLFDSYEEAIEAAIEYVLKNLI